MTDLSSHPARARSSDRTPCSTTRSLAMSAVLALVFALSAAPDLAFAQAQSQRACILLLTLGFDVDCTPQPPPILGREVAVEQRLSDGEEFTIPLNQLMKHGANLFSASWTVQEGAGRPGLKGTGAPLSDPDSPLNFPFNMNRISAPDSNSCAGCHNLPRAGGGGDFVTNVFVLGQRFDFATFDPLDENEIGFETRGAFDENGVPVTLQTIANSRATLGMFGSGYIEMLARQITGDLQAIRDGIAPGGSAELISKGISYGTLARAADGSWIVDDVDGLVPPSLASAGPDAPPNLIIRPFHQASAVISLREFTNNAMNHHHGIQTVERAGPVDADGDGFDNNLSIADVTAVSAWQAQLAVPGRVIPRHPVIEDAVRNGEELFVQIGCANCHVPALPLTDEGWIYTEPNPFNPEGNLRPGEYQTFEMDLRNPALDQPRLPFDSSTQTVWVPAFTDMKVHNITSGPDDPNCELLNMHFPAGTAEFNSGNCQFITKKLWGAANEPPYFHHGLFTTMREAIEAHRGDAIDSYNAWAALDDFGRDSIIEFLKTLRLLPQGTTALVVDENFQPRTWDSAFD